MRLNQKKVGSLLLQEYVSKAPKEVIEKIIDSLDGKLADLMTKEFGNYFCQKLIGCLSTN